MDPADDRTTPDTSPLARAEQREIIERLRLSVGDLPDEQRQVCCYGCSTGLG